MKIIISAAIFVAALSGCTSTVRSAFRLQNQSVSVDSKCSP
jgi:hypothetical protein